MKKVLFMALTATTLLFASCSKKSSDPQPQATNKVTINGTDYATVKIATQTWTAANYNGDGGTYYNGSTTNDVVNGKLYTLAEAKAIVLPTGWRLPTSDDYTKLLNSQSSFKNLMSKTGWTVNMGTNTSGFNAFPSGYYENDHLSDTYMDKGTNAIFLTSSTFTDPAGIPVCFNIYEDEGVNDAILTDIINLPSNKGSIRFVRDN